MCPWAERRISPGTPVSSDVATGRAPVGSANTRRFLAVSTTTSEVDAGKVYWRAFVARLVGAVPAGYGADCNVPAPLVALTALSQYQRVPSGETLQLFTLLATVARLASLPIVCIFRTSGPVLVARDDQAMVPLPGTGK